MHNAFFHSFACHALMLHVYCLLQLQLNPFIFEYIFFFCLLIIVLTSSFDLLNNFYVVIAFFYALGVHLSVTPCPMAVGGPTVCV